MLFGLASGLFRRRRFMPGAHQDRVQAGFPALAPTLHLKLTGAMLFVLVLDGAGYLMAVNSVTDGQKALMAVLEDIFVAVALLTHQRRTGAAGHDHALRDRGQRGRQAT